ncbi:DUF934 domain-containing protein [Denitratisoma oestradiolicum]|uniref:Oxidoreductase n=1 Tax=Denitratisoma oestradiolicum TaxID=311182 RepID=A0A6S6XYB4_9PROT|nr:DUF934 domain-containing protein [Denitratisoma oestradiolicum]TWO81160.1 oxidoreductase [Denitratisoma oestradiolicum]CAB1367852.1 conserved protein of unknown function [Denitratisoma oestradiolicum]
MAKLIKDRRIIEDTWQTLFLAEEETPESVAVPAEPVIVPLAVWLAQRETLAQRQPTLGVWLSPEDEPGDIADDLARFPVVGVHFPVFRDGRGYSTATLLRARYGYRGELRAMGDILRDQLHYLHRVGFDTFAIRTELPAEELLSGFDDFSVAYQGAFRDPQPLFRRRPDAR